MSDRGARVELDGIRRVFGNLVAVDGVSLDIPAGSFFSLLGPSGCGKSTTLRMIAGFEKPDSGRIVIGNDDVTNMAARRRPTAMVFQNYALFPHMTVGENVAYGLTVRRMSRTDVRERVKTALERVDMSAFADTPVPSLSGGQQQRVALARAVAVEPRVILFDEPLSNLDVALRHQTRRELKDLQHRIGLTSVYVTHDQEEAMALSDQIAVMRKGVIVQSGRPEDLYREPGTAFVASFLGGANVIRDRQAAMHIAGVDLPAGKALVIRSEDVRIARPEEEGVVAVIRSRQFLGFATELFLDVAGLATLRILIPGVFESEEGGSAVRIITTANRVVTDDLD